MLPFFPDEEGMKSRFLQLTIEVVGVHIVPEQRAECYFDLAEALVHSDPQEAEKLFQCAKDAGGWKASPAVRRVKKKVDAQALVQAKTDFEIIAKNEKDVLEKVKALIAIVKNLFEAG
jgi:hypothetical protein